MKALISVVGVTAALCSATVFADPDPTHQPMQRADESLVRNIAKNPDNEGLRNAFDRHATNRERQATRGRNQAPGQQKLRADAERAPLADRVAVERVERVERPDRPDRPDRPERPDRPDRPHR